MGLTVRPACPGDVAVIATMIEEIERYYGATTIQPVSERTTQIQRALFDDNPLAHALLAELDGDVVGLASYSYLWPAAGATHSMFLKELFVRDTERRHGVASALMDALRSGATRTGCSRIEWLADADNPAALAFYEALGVSPMRGKVVYRLDGEALTSSS